MPFHVHTLASEAHALADKPAPLLGHARAVARRDAAAEANDPVPGDSPDPRWGERSQSPADGASAARHAQAHGDLAVGHDAAARDEAHRRVDGCEEAALGQQASKKRDSLLSKRLDKVGV